MNGTAVILAGQLVFAALFVAVETNADDGAGNDESSGPLVAIEASIIRIVMPFDAKSDAELFSVPGAGLGWKPQPWLGVFVFPSFRIDDDEIELSPHIVANVFNYLHLGAGWLWQFRETIGGDQVLRFNAPFLILGAGVAINPWQN